MDADKRQSLFESATRMLRETLSLSHPCYLTFPLSNPRGFVAAFLLSDAESETAREKLMEALRKAGDITRDYFGVTARAAVGSIVSSPRELHRSYADARRLIYETSEENPIVFARDGGDTAFDDGGFSFAQIRSLIAKALKEYDAELLDTEIAKVAAFFNDHPGRLVQAVDVASNILYLIANNLPDGELITEQVFSDEPDGYRKLYRLRQTSEVMIWLKRLCGQCRETLKDHRQSYKRQVIARVQEYIEQNLDKRLSLNEVASVFNFSPNYLSQLFAKHTGKGYVEYITNARVEAAKQMLIGGKIKVYEISERLGFENSFYFSKVFKKVVGVSPRKYSQNISLTERT
jgi:two-component system response regulator YesN